MKRHCLRCRALIDSGSYCASCRPPKGSTRAWRALRERVLARDRHRCVVCGALAIEVDHIIPRSQGGADVLANGRSLCAECHQRRHHPA
jgi:5-methylcytosine-specific restriction endonuclease McrA